MNGVVCDAGGAISFFSLKTLQCDNALVKFFLNTIFRFDFAFRKVLMANESNMNYAGN